MKCKNCGEEIANDSKFCENCGTKQGKKTKNKWLWLVLLTSSVAIVGIVEIIRVNTYHYSKYADSGNQYASELVEYSGSASEEAIEENTENRSYQDDATVTEYSYQSENNYEEEYYQENQTGSNSNETNQSYYRVIAAEARIYDYMLASDNSTYLSYLNLVYRWGDTVEGEMTDLPGHGEFLKISWRDDGELKRGFIKSSDIVPYNEYQETRAYYRVTVERASIYEYTSSGADDTYMKDIGYSYSQGATFSGEKVELPNHGTYIFVKWNDSEGNKKRGFVSYLDVEPYYN